MGQRTKWRWGVLAGIALPAIAMATFAEAAEPGMETGDAKIDQLLQKADEVRKANRPIGKPAKDAPTLSDEEIEQIAKYYRELYPYKSLRARLAYEQKLPQDRPLPKLSEEATAKLDEVESAGGRRLLGASVRAQSLRMLHQANVRTFITQEGFGLSRLPSPGPSMLELPEEQPVPFDRIPIASDGYFDEPPRTLSGYEPDRETLLGDDWQELASEEIAAKTDKAYRQWIAEKNPLLMPTTPRLHALHNASASRFANAWSNGDVQDIDRVAGFSEHGLTRIPRFDMAKPWFGYLRGNQTPTWGVTRLQLVSLLKSETPGVYRSKDLPRMEALKKTPTRPLDAFEAKALKRLQAGEDIVVEGRTNRIHLLGSVRATKQCLECHDVHRGELLGAFSYELMRKQPIDLKTIPRKPPARL